MSNLITVETTINATQGEVWLALIDTNQITKWNFAHPSWYCPRAEHKLKVGGKFKYRMEAKDGSSGFDLEGKFDIITVGRALEYTLSDGRKVKIAISGKGNSTTITETFEAEKQNSPEMQKQGWQAILDNFKKHIETSAEED